MCARRKPVFVGAYVCECITVGTVQCLLLRGLGCLGISGWRLAGGA